MRWAVLGAGGCFGTNLVAHLMSLGHDVIGFGRSPRKPACFSLGVDYPYHALSVGSETDLLVPILRRFAPQVICNFAAQGEGAASFDINTWWRFYETNATAMARLTGELSRFMLLPNQTERFIQISTSELYGSNNHAVDENAPLVPTSPYAASKAAFDMHLQAIYKVRGFPMNIVRPSNCYCWGQQLHRIIPKALIAARTGRRLPLHGGGRARKSYLHATDLSRAIVAIAAGPVGEVYNVGPEAPSWIFEIVTACCLAAGKRFKDVIENVGEREGQDGCYWLDSTKIKNLGWAAQISLADGIGEMNQWIDTYPELESLSTEFQLRA